MASVKNITMREYNGTDYDTLYPKTIASQVDGVYNKTEVDTLLANKAPAGFGLGGNAKLLTSADNLDNITQNGWYWWHDSCPSGTVYNYCHMRVDNGQTVATNTVTQTIYQNNTNHVTVRFYDGTKWITEYVNPLMLLGNEYRTTEQYLGKPVYRKLIWGGALPNNGYSNVSLSSECVIIQAVCYATTAASASGFTPSTITDIIPWNNNDDNGINMNAFKNFVNLWCKIDRSSINFVANLRYIKTTD